MGININDIIKKLDEYKNSERVIKVLEFVSSPDKFSDSVKELNKNLEILKRRNN